MATKKPQAGDLPADTEAQAGDLPATAWMVRDGERAEVDVASGSVEVMEQLGWVLE
jgi:hypothetical protein